mmetsp:Transcript_2069/g.8157  ORF Transcript_2069/g.8157 Transcript_2069/m.8157 type:complete len:393 (-) Transcript_2069:1443-2621(-)|eukprot:CAMPEP_0113962592 /NCGR_PEP_ID=MMETSP0011_2-20120614/6009_1 /TAXON_ID=101924 /ORGANISM="Rhodosorus marinus" /LENGTH=392 /DNA_ID=CAMNT_0000974479 /DNA_START=221 /DNA_END=1399 /DNA_ORIENTATION=- /assembly_acc=CAM_ASM_000156
MGKRRRRGGSEAKPDPKASRTGCHRRNPYYEKVPDFGELASRHPELRKHMQFSESGFAHLNLRSVDAQIQLAKTLLKEDFHLEWDLPEGHLCPAIPSRIDYLLWAEDIYKASMPTEVSNCVVDVGTGASCIYPLLGCRVLDQSYRFIAIDNDCQALTSASENVSRNSLQARILVREGSLLAPLGKEERVSFTVCNPPFYADPADPGMNPLRTSSGGLPQMVTSGGELEFLKSLAKESALFPNVAWFTSLVGLKRDVYPFETYLREMNADRVVRTSFQIARTRRWAVAWTFGSGGSVDLKQKSSFRATIALRWKHAESEDVLTAIEEFFQKFNYRAERSKMKISAEGIEAIVLAQGNRRFEVELKRSDSQPFTSARTLESVAEELCSDLRSRI